MSETIRIRIEQLLNTLKPEIRQRAVFVFRDRKGGAEGKTVLADTAYLTEPPVITFYLETIEKMSPSMEALKQIISHELIHTFSKNEVEAYGKQGSMDFFRSDPTD